MSALLRRGLLINRDGDVPRVCLGNAYWGALALPLRVVVDDSTVDPWDMYAIDASSNDIWVHCTDARDWTTFEWQAVVPAKLHDYLPHGAEQCILIRLTSSEALYIYWNFICAGGREGGESGRP